MFSRKKAVAPERRANQKFPVLRGKATGKPTEKLVTRSELLKRKASKQRPKAAPTTAQLQNVGGMHKPPETLEEFKAAYADAQERRSYWFDQANRNHAELARLRVAFAVLGDALVDARNRLGLADEIPF